VENGENCEGFGARPKRKFLLINAVDLCIAFSLEDNLPSTVLEVHSCGTPVMAFKIEGMSDMILHKETEFLADQNLKKALPKAFSGVRVNKARREELGKAARQKMEKEFSLEGAGSRSNDLLMAILFYGYTEGR
jgi:glycosyltransferase involved in cell wall biosynthesis